MTPLPTPSRSGVERLGDFIDCHAFLHDDSLPDNPVDEYCWHPALLAPPLMVVTDQERVGDAYSSFLREIGAWPRELLVPHPKTEASLQNLSADKDARHRLCDALVERDLNISSFYPDNPYIESILTDMRALGRTPVVQPSQEIYSLLSDRNVALALMREAGVPVLDGAVCDTENDIQRVRAALGPTVVIKQGHAAPILLLPAAPVPAALPYPVYVERFAEVLYSPNIQVIAWDGFTPLFSCDQIVSNLMHRGNRSRSFQDDMRTQFERILKSVEPLLSEIAGPVGVDTIVDTEGRVWVVDINPRFNSCTYPQYFVASHARGRELQFVYEQIPLEVETLDEICMANGFPRFDPSTGLGSLIIGHVVASTGKIELGFLLSIGGDSAEAESAHTEAKRRASL